MQTALQPILHKDAYTSRVEAEILSWLREAIFQPLLLALDEHGIPVKGRLATVRDNASISLASALQSGRVHFSGGVFSGKFSASLSKELRGYGARFQSTTKTFHLASEELPYEIRNLLSEATTNASDAHLDVASVLRAVEENIPKTKTVSLTEHTIILEDLNKQFEVSVKGKMETPFAPTSWERELILEDLTHNVDLTIKDFAAERIPILRRRVEENLKLGGRVDRLVAILESEFGMAQRKAEFIAEQETSLLVSKYRQLRYDQIGVQEYVWITSGDERVRPDHAALDGQRFSYDHPPITNRATGARNNPGEDYSCRCTARPILNLHEMLQ